MVSIKFFPAAAFLGVTAQETCYLPLDVMFLQDTTGSFDDDLPNVVSQIPDMVSQILSNHPESYFGVAEFKDKPYFPLGEADDFCYRLGAGSLSSDITAFTDAYSVLYASGGGDLPEAQFQALINVALDPLVGWRPIAPAGSEATAAQAGARIVIMSTDAVPHLPGDMQLLDPNLYPDVPRDLPANTGTIVDGDVNYSCLNEDYPSADQMAAVLRSRGIYLAILTPNDDAITGAWKWVNEDLLNQPAGFYQFISSDSSDLITGVLSAVEAVTAYACATTTAAPVSSDTTLAPVTEAPTTLPPVTEAPTTLPPVTEAPTTLPPVTEAPTTLPPVTEAPTTLPPVTEAPTTLPPVTEIPESTEAQDCPPCPCIPPCPKHCECLPRVVVKVAERPSLLRIDYVK